MIPKIIHYCWFGGKPIPEGLQRCIDSWSKLEGYQVMRWDESNCSFDENEFVKITHERNMLGFIGDYYRLKSVYEYGGIYLDTDVMINKSFDELLDYPCFINFIFDCSIGSAIIGAQKGNEFIGNLLKMYDNMIIEEDRPGKQFEWKGELLSSNKIPVSNYCYTYYILKNYSDFKLNNKFQDMKDFVIFPKEMFEIGKLSGNYYATHLNSGEWRVKKDTSRSLKARIKYILQGNEWLFTKVQIIVRTRRYKKLNKGIPFYSYYLAQKKNLELPEL